MSKFSKSNKITKSCKNKIDYKSEKEALLKINMLNQNKKFLDELSAYQCNHCREWHIGKEDPLKINKQWELIRKFKFKKEEIENE